MRGSGLYRIHRDMPSPRTCMDVPTAVALSLSSTVSRVRGASHRYDVANYAERIFLPLLFSLPAQTSYAASVSSSRTHASPTRTTPPFPNRLPHLFAHRLHHQNTSLVSVGITTTRRFPHLSFRANTKHLPRLYPHSSIPLFYLPKPRVTSCHARSNTVLHSLTTSSSAKTCSHHSNKRQLILC